MICTINTATYWMAVDINKHVARPVLGPSLGEAEARWILHMVNDDLRCASSQDHRQRRVDEVSAYRKRHIRFFPIAEPIT